jgi:uncharacterized protein (DUF1810 family)
MSLERFVQAQAKEQSYERALAELRGGRKTGHWIWWIFPQLRGLGWSERSTYYGLIDEAEAKEYLRHPILGARYRDCLEVVHGHLCKDGLDPMTLMGGHIDVVKLRSSVELFLKAAATSEESFGAKAEEVLERIV